MIAPRWTLVTLSILALAISGCDQGMADPEPWTGPRLEQPRTQATVEHLLASAPLPFLDMSFFARPTWAHDDAEPLSGTIAFADSRLVPAMTREAYPGERLFPALRIDVVTDGGVLIPRRRDVIDMRTVSESYWDLSFGPGRVWREAEDDGWSRASFPVNLHGRYVGEVRNCVATFVYRDETMSNVALQCSQETAVLEAQQVGDVRAMLQATFEAGPLADADALRAAHRAAEARRIPTAPLTDIDRDGRIADYFERSFWTRASTSLGAVYLDGTLYVHPASTRHGTYPYEAEMRHGVFSVTKSAAGALALFYFAERYGEEIFDALIVDYVPAFAHLPEWQGVTFAHTLNMVTGTRAGDRTEEDLLYEPLELAPDKEAAIRNIARFGDYPEAPGERFNYATTHTFVLSYALQNYVEEREGEGVLYWDLVREHVLEPIGAGDFGVLLTRDELPSERIPILGLGAVPTLDEAAKIARLIWDEGVYEGQQLLNRNAIREALGRTEWRGYDSGGGTRYRHSFWSRTVRVGLCQVQVTFMEGMGGNHVLFLPSGAIAFRFMDEFDMDTAPLIRAVEGVRSSCR
jgi:CubicO group peptidase (beta-lactamase class C family)